MGSHSHEPGYIFSSWFRNMLLYFLLQLWEYLIRIWSSVVLSERITDFWKDS